MNHTLTFTEFINESYILALSKEKYDSLSPYQKTMQVSGESMGNLVNKVPIEEIEFALNWLKDNKPSHSLGYLFNVKIDKLETAISNRNNKKQ